MSLRLNKITLYVVKVLYVLIVPLSIPNLIFRDIWYTEQSQYIGVPYSLFLIANIFSTFILSLIIASLVMLFRLLFGRALICGLISTVLMIIDLNAFLKRLELPVNSEITNYTIMISLLITTINIYLLFSIYYHNEKDKLIIKKVLLDLGMQYSRLEIVDIAEKSSMNREKVERVVIEMLNKKEFYGEYLAKKKIIEFNVELNNEEIDNLLEIYKKWEDKAYYKKKE